MTSFNPEFSHGMHHIKHRAWGLLYPSLHDATTLESAGYGICHYECDDSAEMVSS